MGQHERCPRYPQKGEGFVSDPGLLARDFGHKNTPWGAGEMVRG